jgi:hypothetical protein
MITASIVTYKTDFEELKKVLSCTTNSIIETIYIIDNSPTNELKIISNRDILKNLDYSEK